MAARTLAGLATVVPRVLAGATDPNGIAFVDVDDTIRQTHGYQKQGVAYGYCKVKGLNALSDALRVRRVREDPQRGNAHHCQIFGLSLKDANNLFSNPLPWASL